MQQICAYEECRLPFEAKRADARFCSANCRSRSRRSTPENQDTMSSVVKSENLQVLPALREVGTGRSTERDGEDPAPGTLLFTAAEGPAAPSTTALDLTALAPRFQSLESRLSRLEHTSVDDASLASLQDHLLKVERRLDQLQAKQAEQAPAQDADAALARSIAGLILLAAAGWSGQNATRAYMRK